MMHTSHVSPFPPPSSWAGLFCVEPKDRGRKGREGGGRIYKDRINIGGGRGTTLLHLLLLLLPGWRKTERIRRREEN